MTNTVFDNFFNGATHSEMYRAWVMPELFPDQPQPVLSNWSHDDIEMFVGAYGANRAG